MPVTAAGQRSRKKTDLNASRYIGRVGGLAVALGVGAAAFSAAVASADSDVSANAAGASANAAGASANEAGASAQSASHRGGATSAGPARSTRTDSAASRSRSGSAGRTALRTATIDDAPAPAAARTVSLVARAAADESESTPDPVLPDDAPVYTAAPEVIRAEALAATSTASSATVEPSSIFNNHITATPTVEWGGTLAPPTGAVALPGILVGSVNAVSSAGLDMTYVVVRRPNEGGKIGGGPLLPLTNFYGPAGGFTYLPYSTTLTDPTATEKFSIMAMELTDFDKFFINALGGAGHLVVTQLLAGLHRIPIIGDLLSPIIGQAKNIAFDVNPYTLAADPTSLLGAQRPTAFTYKMPSFDGTLISVNYFPATNVAKGEAVDAPTVLAASGLACAANTDPTTRYGQLFPGAQFGSLTPGIAPLRDDAFKSTLRGGLDYKGGGGYNVITWDPRGEFASGGQLEIDNPFFEGRDVSSIISWLNSSTNPAANQVRTLAGDPLVGMTGGSYGGGIQLTTVDPRIDAITPEIAWDSLLTSLNPDGVFKTGWGTILAAALAFTGARINPAIYQGIFTGAAFGFLSQSSQAVLGSVGPTVLLTKEQAATMVFQGIHDTLFPLQQSVDIGQTIQTSPADPPLKVFWFCGGHGDCAIPNKPMQQDQYGIVQNLMWMDQYVAGSGTPATDKIPTFQWFDQNGLYYNSKLLPWNPSFNDAGTYKIPTSTGGFLPIVPILGGSGPYPIGDLPFSIASAGPARNVVQTTFTPPAGKQVVGAPKVSFTYSGLGNASAVYAQLVDNKSGLVLSNSVTPVPVTLDGRTHTVTMDMADVAYTAGDGGTLTLQITSSAVNFEKFWSYGFVNISDVGLTLPQHTAVDPVPFVT